MLRTVVDFSHTSTPSAVRPRTIAEFEAKLRSETLLDPFDPQAGALAFMPDRDPNDLTWTFHLTSISEIGDRRYATIDGMDYEQGDRLDGREISSIGDDTVTLKEPVTGGEKRLVPSFSRRLQRIGREPVTAHAKIARVVSSGNAGVPGVRPEPPGCGARRE